MREFTIGPNDAGQRLDRWLAKTLPLLPAPLAQKYIRIKRVKCNGKGAKRDTRLVQGDVLQLYINDEFFDTPTPENAFLSVFKPQLDIVYEDENLLLVNKRPGLVVHPDEQEKVNTLLTHIQAYLYQKKEWNPRQENAFAPALCNRIDRNTGGIVIAAIYMAGSFGIGAAIPADQIDPDFGMLYAVITMVGETSPIFIIIAVVFLITLFANMASWSFGVNAVAQYAAKNQNMPRVFAHENPKTGMPTGAAIVNGIVATAVLLIQLIPNEAISDGLFWTLFATSVVFLLLTYIPMFPAFIKLRKVDANRPRVYRFPFQGTAMKVILAIPVIELVLAVVATLVPFSAEEVADKVPMIAIFIIFLLLGEVVRIVSARGRKEEFKGLTPAMAAERLAEEAAGEPDSLEPVDPAQVEQILAADDGKSEKIL